MYNKDTVISKDGEEVQGNSANRFDTWRQSTTLGPEPPVADGPPPETSAGTSGNPPVAGGS